MAHRLVLLPGMHGTGDLFAPFLKLAPEDVECTGLDYPVDQPLGYEQLYERTQPLISRHTPMFLLGESFSGPLAIRFAAEHPQCVQGLILCATFVRFHVHPLAPIALKLFGHARPPDWLLKRTLAGDAALEQMLQLLRKEIRRVAPAVFARRIEEVGRVDAREQLRRCAVPVMYLRAELDRIMKQSHVREVVENCDHVELETIRSPHLLLQTCPREAWERVSGFMDHCEKENH